MRAFGRLLRVLAWHAAGEPPARAGEAAARITLYPTSRRTVKSEAHAASTAGPLTAKETRDAA